MKILQNYKKLDGHHHSFHEHFGISDERAKEITDTICKAANSLVDLHTSGDASKDIHVDMFASIAQNVDDTLELSDAEVQYASVFIGEVASEAIEQIVERVSRRAFSNAMRRAADKIWPQKPTDNVSKN